eukprot:TRINITY_DN6215_c0_g3_i1.p1 TRINITY_DN6215_c0_g3~~TRINITY_DN6215_c0_g3_i1.p1  ORF type:complete len:345 (-),score=85.86 TRINITY_DN6215_c0_g3_i1:347-1330(-)
MAEVVPSSVQWEAWCMEKDIRDLSNSTVLVTGSNQGMGRAVVQKLLLHSNVKKVIMACRSEEKTKEAMLRLTQEVKPGSEGIDARLDFLRLDLGDLDQVKIAADELKTKYDRIDICVNNAGTLVRSDNLRTRQGYEVCMGVNHLGHFLFNARIFSLLKKSKAVTGVPARIVSVASLGHEMSKGIDFETWLTKASDGMAGTYCDSKLANVQYMFALKRRLEAAGLQDDIHVTSLQPGYASEFYRSGEGCLAWFARQFAVSPESLAINQVRHAVDLEGIPSGTYTQCKNKKFYGPPVIAIPAPVARDEVAQEKLWEKSEEAIGEKFTVA